LGSALVPKIRKDQELFDLAAKCSSPSIKGRAILIVKRLHAGLETRQL